MYLLDQSYTVESTVPVQVGEGEVDFAALAEAMDRMAPGKPFIPEIWMGHVNNGQGFWHALNLLEQWF